jgi:sarcosine oxidase subunit alpha
MRLPPQPNERIDRSTASVDREGTVVFTFEGAPIRAFPGDTIASALFAAGRRTFTRSFKYHRPRGLLCCQGHCPNCMMTVDGRPHVRTCVEPVRGGEVVKAQNVLGSLERDLMAVTDKIGGPFTPVGFYYRTFIRPRWAWRYYEKFLRNAAGLGRLDEHAGRRARYDVEHRHTELIVIGGGEAGLAAAREAAAIGEHVTLVDEGVDLLPQAVGDEGFEVIAPGRALGLWEGGLVPVESGNVLYRIRAERIVVATGAMEQPLVFPGNDLVGVMLPGAVRRLVDYWALKPGERAVVVTADDRGLEAAETLQRAGTRIAEVVDLRERRVRSIAASGRKGHVRSVEIDGGKVDCDLVVMSGGAQPNYSLLAQLGARIEYDSARGIFVPAELPANVEAVGAVTGDVGPTAVPAASYNGAGGHDKCFVCYCEDVTDKDVKRAIAEGFDSIELAKRYTTVTMGPCQGKLCHLGSIRLYARENETDEASIGTTTARPPWAPVPLGLLAGRPHEPGKRTSIHHRHRDLGATVIWTGAWRRPHSYGDPQAEAKNVHETIGVIDVSTLGKILVRGPEAGAFLDRIYTNRFSDLKPGRIRYGIVETDAGRIMDDGTIARLDDETFYVTTTSTGVGGVLQWFGWWNAVWGLDVEITDITGALAAVNVAGPRARELMAGLTDLDVSNEGIKYLDAVQGHVAGVPCLVLRIGFVGELGYEIHFPSPYGEYFWDTLLEEGADLGIRPFGLEPQRVLRLEKMHILIGQDTDSESNVLEANMPWIVKWDKDDFVGKWSLEHVQGRDARWKLVGFEVPSGVVPPEGAQLVRDGKPAGRVTSSRWSPALEKAIGMGWVPADQAAEGDVVQVRVDGALVPATVRLRPFFDPEGERLKA